MKRKQNILKLYKYPTARSSVRNNKAITACLGMKQPFSGIGIARGRKRGRKPELYRLPMSYSF
jgi:hypothetical protein